MASRLYVANSGENTISVIDCDRLEEIDRISLPDGAQGPRRLLLRGEELYHADCYSATVGRFYGAKKRRSELVGAGACPTGLCAVPGGIVVSCGESNSVWGFEQRPLRPRWCAQTGAFPVGIASIGERLAVAELFTGRVRFWKGESCEQERLFEGEGMPLCIAAGGEGYLAGYLLGSGAGQLWRFLPAEAPVSLDREIPPAGQIFCLKGQNKAVAAHVWDDSFSLIDWKRMEVLWTKAAGRMPDDLCADREGKTFFVSCMLEDAVRVFDSEGRLLRRVPVGKEPRGLALEEISPVELP